MESIKYEPKFGRVLIKREVKEKTAGGILLLDPKRTARCEGVIVALGETAGWVEAYNDNGDLVPQKNIKVGDKVLFGRHSGVWLDSSEDKGVEKDDGTLFMCQDADILAVIKEQK